MDEQISGVNGGASIPSSGDSSSPMAADSGGIQEATPAPGPVAGNEPAQVMPTEASADASTQDAEPSDPFEADVQAIPEQQRDKFTSLLQHKKSLEKDLRGWRGLAEQFGDPETIAARLAQLEGLGSYATDPVGQTVIDPNTGLPRVTTAPWLERMMTDSPGLVDQLGYDLWNQKTANGQSYGAKFFWEAFQNLGLDPNRVQDYAALPASQVAAGQPSPDELQYIDASLHAAYGSLTAAERKVVQSLIENNTPEDDLAVRDILKREQERAENAKFREEFQQQMKKQEEAEIGTFWQDVNATFEQAVSKANTEALASLNQQISTQVQFSSDPKTNAIQSGMVSALVAAMCSPETRFAVAPILEQIGATFDPQVEQYLANASQAEREYIALSKLEGNERFAQYRNSYRMQEAKRESDRLRQMATAKLAPVALKIAKAIATGNQGIREASLEDLKGIQSRPTVGNGSVGNVPQGQTRYPRGKEFDFSYQPT